jgi:hypothetical protein
MRQGWKIFNLFVVTLMAAIYAQGSRAAQPAGKVTQLPPRSDKQAAAVERSRESEPQEIIIWKVGDPHKGELPDTSISSSLEQIAEKMGFRMAVRAFPAVGFARQFFDAFDEGLEPDILAINNYGIINGIKTALGDFTGIGSNKAIREKLVRSPNPYGGWEMADGNSWSLPPNTLMPLNHLPFGPSNMAYIGGLYMRTRTVWGFRL